MKYVICHDNGVKGEIGFSEESGNITNILNEYNSAGIHVESWFEVNTENE